MVLIDFLQKRRSVRKFKKDLVSKEELERIKGYCNTIEEDFEGLKFFLMENGELVSKALKGKAGYAGVTIEAPHYLGVAVENEDRRSMLKMGYVIESLNTVIIEMGLDTCWLTVAQVDEATMKSVFGKSGSKIKYLIAFGYREGKKLFEENSVSFRYPISEVVFRDKIGEPVTLEYLEDRALLEILSSIRYAPSHKNLQPWRFVVEETDVVLYMVKYEDEEENKASLVDMGIVMMYFEEMVKNLNVSNKWEIIFEEEGDYIKIGKFLV